MPERAGLLRAAVRRPLPLGYHPLYQFWNWKIGQPTAALSMQIFTYAISPFDEWHRQAWAGALVLIILIVAAVAAVRIAVRHGTLAGA